MSRRPRKTRDRLPGCSGRATRTHTASPTPDLESLRAVLREGVEDRVVPGISLLLAHRGEVIFKEAFGNLKLDQKAQMASSSKPVTATLLMILVDRGKLALDDPIEKYLPEFKGIALHGQAAGQAADGPQRAVEHVGPAGRPPDRVDPPAAAGSGSARPTPADPAKGRQRGRRRRPAGSFFYAGTARWPSRCVRWPKEGWRPSRGRSSTTAPWASTWRRGWPRRRRTPVRGPGPRPSCSSRWA